MSWVELKTNKRKVANNMHQAWQFFQIQDDYLDCYGDPKVIGKIGRILRTTNVGGWWCKRWRSARQAKENNRREYGKDGEREKDQEVIVELELEKLYLEYEEKSYKELTDIMEGQWCYRKSCFQHVGEDLQKNK